MFTLDPVRAVPALPPGPRPRGRLSRNAQVVLAMLTGRERPATAHDLHDELRSAGKNTGLTTIYLALHALAEAGAVHEFRTGDQSAYLVCPADPHEHLICRVCGRVQQQHLDPENCWQAAAAAVGFETVEQRVEFYGVCDRCRR
jgi:Fur family ferric uptake transcriptional regulator